MALSIEIEVPQAVIFDQGTEKQKRRKNDQTGTQARTCLIGSLTYYFFSALTAK